MSKAMRLETARTRLDAGRPGYSQHEVDVFLDRLLYMYQNGLQPSPQALLPHFTVVEEGGYDRDQVDVLLGTILQDELAVFGVETAHGEDSRSHNLLLGMAVILATILFCVLLAAGLL